MCSAVPNSAVVCTTVRTGERRYRRKYGTRGPTRQVVPHATLRHSAHVTGRLRTANYSQEARDRLARAVTNARESAGYRYRTDFAKATQGVSKRSLDAVENSEPTVGGTVLRAIGRALPTWDEDTAQAVLEGGPIPANIILDLRDDNERKLFELDLPEDVRWGYIRIYRERQAQAQTGQ